MQGTDLLVRLSNFDIFSLFQVFLSEEGVECMSAHKEEIQACINNSVPEVFNTYNNLNKATAYKILPKKPGISTYLNRMIKKLPHHYTNKVLTLPPLLFQGNSGSRMHCNCGYLGYRDGLLLGFKILVYLASLILTYLFLLNWIITVV